MEITPSRRRSLALVALVIGFPTLLNTRLHAQIIRDGSIGPSVSLQPTGPAFEITENMGETAGSNLFHSFSEFSFTDPESVAFLANGSILNIFSRVTGGNASLIDGRLSAQASLWFINPYGLVFGEHDAVDVAGSFYATTAAYVEFDGGDQFHASPLRSTVLSISPPRSFGFLDATTRPPILVHGDLRGRPPDERARLNLPDEEASIFLIGSSATLGSSTVSSDSAGGGSDVIIDREAEDLTLNRVFITGRSLLITAGDVTIERSRVDLGRSGGDAGDLIILADGDLQLDETRLSASVAGHGNAGSIRLTARTGDLRLGAVSISTIANIGGSGDISLQALEGDVTLLSGAKTSQHFTSLSFRGRAGPVTIAGNAVTLGTASVSSDVGIGAGTSGDISITARDGQLVLAPGTTVTSRTHFGGTGSIELSAASGEVRLDGIHVSTSVVRLPGAGGVGGDIDVTAPVVTLTGGSRLEANNGGDGFGGQITVNATRLRLEAGSAMTTEAASGFGGGIVLNVGEVLELVDSVIATNAEGRGDGGNITITMRVGEPDSSHMLLERGTLAANSAEGRGGRMVISTGLFIASADPETAVTATSGVGLDGEIQITAPDAAIVATLTTLPVLFQDAAGLIREQCSARRPETGGSLVVRGRGGVPASPDGLLPTQPSDVARVATAGGPDYVGALVGTAADGRPVLLTVRCGP